MTKRWEAEGVRALATDLLAERDALRLELTETQATLNAALEGRRWQMEHRLKAEAEVARLTERLRIAEAALAEIARHAEQRAARTLALGTLNALAAAE